MPIVDSADDSAADPAAAKGAAEGAEPVATTRPTVFLSYATQDRPAARALQQAMSSFGLEVWLDESELGGGEAWDQKIRKQIRECQYFMPVVSAQTEARVEGYFRREWRLAVERSLDIADDHLFLLPVVIDGTDQAKARVPEKFLTVQWLRLPGGRSTPALEALCRRIASGDTAVETSPRKAVAAVRKAARAIPDFPPYPVRVPGHSMPHWLAVLAWGGQTTWAGYRRLPRWIRVIVAIWIFIAVLSRLGDGDKSDSVDVTPEKAQKIAEIAKNYKGNVNKADIARLGEQIAREFASDGSGNADALLALPFGAPEGNDAAAKLADATFATVYGRIALARKGHVALGDSAQPVVELGDALARGKAGHASYVLYGAVEKAGAGPTLAVRIASVDDKTVLWSGNYPLAGADPAKIATEIEAKVAGVAD